MILSLFQGLLVCVWLLGLCHGAEYEAKKYDDPHHEETGHHEAVPADSILYPVFILVMGVVAYRILSRRLRWLPYTAVMFIVGTIIGAGATRLDNHNLLSESIEKYWLKIDSELLLVAFLPGLLFHDATGQNTHLFRVAFSQCAIFAFPMVLAGTTLTALVGYYIFPYNWSFNLAMTFGSILAATDPVAVAALLEEVGAPPRLKTHIAGEALLNDGSAIVFFKIFSGLYLLELGVQGVGEEVDLPKGVSMFFQLAVGGACVGIFFAIGLLCILYKLPRQLEREENITQVGAAFAVCYLCYFVADVAWQTSGVIAVVTLGVVTKALGNAYINDHKLMEDFWGIIEWLLNTVLFSVGGLVWGSVICNKDEEIPENEFTAEDWGYLGILFGLLTVIRFGLFLVAFPVTKRLGLGSNMKEMIFQSFGGLRGAVGISLAIYLDNIVRSNYDGEDPTFAIQSNKLFGMIGGVAFLSLVINGVLAGPLLRKLGLTDACETRKQMLEAYRSYFRVHTIQSFVRLLGEEDRFHKVSVAVVRHHVPVLADMTHEEVGDAIVHVYGKDKLYAIKDELISGSFNEDDEIDISAVLDFIRQSDKEMVESSHHVLPQRQPPSRKSTTEGKRRSGRRGSLGAKRGSMVRLTAGAETKDAKELRRMFLELIRASYEKQIKHGELSEKDLNVLALQESLEFAKEGVDRGEPLHDWDFFDLVQSPGLHVLRFVQNRIEKTRIYKSLFAPLFGTAHSLEADVLKDRMMIERCLAFIHGHESAQAIFKQRRGDSDLESSLDKVIRESQGQIDKAKEYLESFAEHEVDMVICHQVCKILLNQAVAFIIETTESGLLEETEAGEYLEDLQRNLKHIEHCGLRIHPGEKGYDATKDISDPSDEEGDDISVEA